MSDIDVLAFDTFHGMTVMNIGDLIREYNTLNKEPEYSLERVWGFEIILKHSVAGFLGVYANLVTCTIPHGLVISTVSGRPDKQWCAGDDAGSASDKRIVTNRTNTFLAAQTIGSISKEKTFSDQEPDHAIALKRRFVRLDTFCTLQPNILFPPFSSFFEGDPRFRDSLYEHTIDRLHTFCSGLMSMLYQMSQDEWDEGDTRVLRQLLPELYRVLHLPREGWFPPLCGQLPYSKGQRIDFSVPRILGPFWNADPNVALLDAYMPEYYSGSSYEEIPWDGIIRDEWESNTSKHLNLLVKLGYLEREEVRTTYVIPEDVAQAVYRDFIGDRARRSFIVYKFNTVGTVPELYNLI
jgi:hypothetical protein